MGENLVTRMTRLLDDCGVHDVVELFVVYLFYDVVFVGLVGWNGDFAGGL